MYKSKVNIMANKDLFKQAIADAKSIREAAIANAKLALEESLTPQLKELLAQRLTEMEEEDAPATVISEEEVAEEVQEETLEEAIGPDGLQAVAEAEEEHSEEGEVEGDEAGEEAEVDSEESEDEAEEEVGEMSVDDLKDLIRDVLMQVMGDQEQAQEDELGADAEDMGAEDMTAVTDTEINIDELMAELATLNSPEGPTAHGNILEMEEVVDPIMEAAIEEMKKGLNEKAENYMHKLAERRNCSVMELIKEFAHLGAISEMKKVADMVNSAAGLGEAAFYEVMKNLIPEKAHNDAHSNMEEMYDIGDPSTLPMASKVLGMAIPVIVALTGLAYTAVKDKLSKGGAEAAELLKQAEDKAKEVTEGMDTLRNDLNETNLLNAKLLYVNKVFKASNLSESQKASVIAAFDKAETVKEVKLVYETVSENVSSVGKKEVVREAKGFASAAAGISTKPGVITETNQAVLRMQKLAGIIK